MKLIGVLCCFVSFSHESFWDACSASLNLVKNSVKSTYEQEKKELGRDVSNLLFAANKVISPKVIGNRGVIDGVFKQVNSKDLYLTKERSSNNNLPNDCSTNEGNEACGLRMLEESEGDNSTVQCSYTGAVKKKSSGKSNLKLLCDNGNQNAKVRSFQRKSERKVEKTFSEDDTDEERKAAVERRKKKMERKKIEKIKKTKDDMHKYFDNTDDSDDYVECVEEVDDTLKQVNWFYRV
ncbi:hypothetical protein NGRA_0076 [Nosema granulosis]|uniref:Uncharacterized protein n=1 Tax=Nosema granulosis TaxID=83296 RepID=A0A9P6KZY2_9MICR|nr:hypothetical protein NGRA_0076 [Nosema granulosis]